MILKFVDMELLNISRYGVGSHGYAGTLTPIMLSIRRNVITDAALVHVAYIHCTHNWNSRWSTPVHRILFSSFVQFSLPHSHIWGSVIVVLSLIRCKSMERIVEWTERERERFMKHLIVTQPNPLTPWENHYLVIVSYICLCVFLLSSYCGYI